MKPMKATKWVGMLVMPLIATWIAGCGEHDHDHGAHGADKPAGGHRHASAHGGVAVELGAHQYQLDLLHDAGAGTLTAWVMDAHMDGFVRLPLASLEVTLKSATWTNALSLKAVGNATTGEKVGDTSQFQGAAEWLKGSRGFTGVLPSLEIRGSRFTDLNFEYAPATELRAK